MTDELINGRAFTFSSGLKTLDPFEGYQLVRERGGRAVETSGNSARAATEVLVVADDLASGKEETAYVKDAREKGVEVMAESAFWRAVGFEPPAGDAADHWVLVDTRMETAHEVWTRRIQKAVERGNLEMVLNGVVSEISTLARSNAATENAPAWDGTVAPYTLFIQHGTAKKTSMGDWKVVACGFLTGDEVFTENAGGVTRLDDGTVVTDTLHGKFLDGREKNPVPWAEWRDEIGKVVVRDRYAPMTCEYLFDGLRMCSRYDLLGLDTSACTSMRCMFRGSASVEDFTFVRRFDTSKVADMTEMFAGCIAARFVDCRDWDFSGVEETRSMFANSPATVLCAGDERSAAPAFDSGACEGVWLSSAGGPSR